MKLTLVRRYLDLVCHSIEISRATSFVLKAKLVQDVKLLRGVSLTSQSCGGDNSLPFHMMDDAFMFYRTIHSH